MAGKEKKKRYSFQFRSDIFPWMSGHMMVFGMTSLVQFKGNQFPLVEVCERSAGFNALSDVA